MVISTNKELVEWLKKKDVLKWPLVKEAFFAVDRKDFVPEHLANVVYFDNPLPIGFGQTISQPYTVAFMLDLLKPRPGDKILDIGAGSGWQTALLGYIVSAKGKRGEVIAVERIEELKGMAETNVEKYGLIKKKTVKVMHADAAEKIKPAPYFDKIISAATTSRVLETWIEQLKIGGRMVIPLEKSIWVFVKKDKDKVEGKEFPGFAFVPLITNI